MNFSTFNPIPESSKIDLKFISVCKLAFFGAGKQPIVAQATIRTENSTAMAIFHIHYFRCIRITCTIALPNKIETLFRIPRIKKLWRLLQTYKVIPGKSSIYYPSLPRASERFVFQFRINNFEKFLSVQRQRNGDLICARDDLCCNFFIFLFFSPQDKHYLCVMASDTPDQNLSQYFSICNDFIHAARLRGGNVLIHWWVEKFFNWQWKWLKDLNFSNFFLF